MDKDIFSGNYITVKIEDGIEKVFLRKSVHTFLITSDSKIRVTAEKKLGDNSVKEKLQGGILDQNESPLECAKRELLEEMGLTAQHWHLYETQELFGTVNDCRYYYIAKGLNKVSAETDGEVLGSKDYTLSQLWKKALDGSFNPMTRAVIGKLYFENQTGIITL